MSRVVLLVVALTVGACPLYSVAQACGDKFLIPGRGAKFQRAYASVYPGRLLIYVKPSTDSKAAIRDPQVQKALRQAGHTVSIIEDWTLLEQAVKTGPVDIILVDAAEASRLQPLVAASLAQPEAMYVAFPSKQSAAADKSLNIRLKSSDRAIKYLDEIENVMKARSRRAKNS